MSANGFGERFRITTFGESHGPALGVVIDGCPASVKWQESLLRQELGRRRPGKKDEGRPSIVTDRNESDEPEVLSGVFDGYTLGTPITIITRNQDARSHDYDEVAKRARTGHADDVWKSKFGRSDHRGGGRSSGRETVARVMAGAVAQMFLTQTIMGLRVTAFMRQAGEISLDQGERDAFAALVRNSLGKRNSYPADGFVGRFPASSNKQSEFESMLVEAKTQGRSHGGIAEVWIDGCPENLGQPVFRKLKADLAAAFMSVGATSAVEIGAGFEGSSAEGTAFHSAGADSDRYGGIRGGISTGERITARIHFKPTASVLDVSKMGRHDPCIVPRAVPVLEAMSYLVIADHVLWSRGDRARPI